MLRALEIQRDNEYAIIKKVDECLALLDKNESKVNLKPFVVAGGAGAIIATACKRKPILGLGIAAGITLFLLIKDTRKKPVSEKRFTHLNPNIYEEIRPILEDLNIDCGSEINSLRDNLIGCKESAKKRLAEITEENKQRKKKYTVPLSLGVRLPEKPTPKKNLGTTSPISPPKFR